MTRKGRQRTRRSTEQAIRHKPESSFIQHLANSKAITEKWPLWKRESIQGSNLIANTLDS